jgi:acyl-CoA thioesterase-2
MAFDLDDLIKCMSLRDVEGDVEGDNLGIGYHRVFGGQILAQIVSAASAASPEKTVKSMTVLFPREGDTSKPMRYTVNRLQDGRTFGTTEVTAHQDGKTISAALLSMHAPEASDLHRSDPPPAVGRGIDATPSEIPMIPFEIRVVGDVDLAAKQSGPAEYQMWMRAPGAAGAATAIQQGLLAHSTDLTIIGTALRPFEGVSQADSTVTLHTAVTAHSMWFHQPFDVSEWLLLAQASPVVANGRAFGRGDVYNSQGEIVASFAQESMIRKITPSAE